MTLTRTVETDDRSREVQLYLRSRHDRIYLRWSVTRYHDGERYRSFAACAGRWKRTLRYHRSANG